MRVGTRKAKSTKRDCTRDHPHACGDKDLAVIGKLCCKGSSPCVWGQATLDGKVEPTSGIIPMRVGTRIDRYGIGCI